MLIPFSLCCFDDRNAMEAVNISSSEQDDLFQLVAGVLHLGDVDFVASEDGESSSLSEDHKGALKLASDLLGMYLSSQM